MFRPQGTAGVEIVFQKILVCRLLEPRLNSGQGPVCLLQAGHETAQGTALFSCHSNPILPHRSCLPVDNI